MRTSGVTRVRLCFSLHPFKPLCRGLLPLALFYPLRLPSTPPARSLSPHTRSRERERSATSVTSAQCSKARHLLKVSGKPPLSPWERNREHFDPFQPEQAPAGVTLRTCEYKQSHILRVFVARPTTHHGLLVPDVPSGTPNSDIHR